MHVNMTSFALAASVVFPVLAKEPDPVFVHLGVPSDADVLYDGKSVDAWRNVNGGPAAWKIQADGSLLVNKEGNTPTAVLASIYTKDVYTNFQLHVEFRIPDPPGEGHGNSGVILSQLFRGQSTLARSPHRHPPCGVLSSGKDYIRLRSGKASRTEDTRGQDMRGQSLPRHAGTVPSDLRGLSLH